MSTSGKTKIYKNPARKAVPSGLKPYVPQYQLMGVEPEEYNSPTSSSYRIEHASKPVTVSRDNPRAPRPLIRQPYAETTSSPVGRGKGLLPNVGNNMEQTWSSIDGEIIDDLGDAPVDPNQKMVDNNDFVSEEALGLPENDDMEVRDADPDMFGQTVHGEEWENLPEATENTGEIDVPLGKSERTFLTEDELQNALKDELFSEIVKQLKEEDYLLLVDGTSICSGPLEEVQEQARGLVFGEHPLCDGVAVPIEDIVIIKRVKIKVGLFLE